MLTDDTLKFNLDINGNPARKEMNRLGQETNKLKKINKDLNVELQKMAANGKEGSVEFKKLEKQIEKNEQSIKTNNKASKALLKTMDLDLLTTKELRKEYRRLKTARDGFVPQSAAWKKANKQMQAYHKRLVQTTRAQQRANKVFGMLKTALPIFSIGAAVSALKRIKDKAEETRTTFAKYEAVLKNTLGSQRKANKEFTMLATWAANTPYQLDEATDSFIKLTNQGFKPTEKEMTKMGDLASSMGKSFDQLTEAILDAQQGENERLKEFGIRAEKNGDKIKYTFKGVTTEVDNNAEAIRNYILSLGDMESVKGGMAEISKTIGGAASNATDSTDALFNSIGKKLEPALISLYRNYSMWANKVAKSLEPQKEQVNLYKLENKEVNVLFRSLTNTNLSQDARKKLIGEINNKYGEYLPNLLTEKSTLKEIEDAHKAVNKQLRIRVISQAMQEELTELVKREKAAVESLVTAEVEHAKHKQKMAAEYDPKMFEVMKQQEKMFDLSKDINNTIVENAEEKETEIKGKYKKIAEYYSIAFDDINKAMNFGGDEDNFSTSEAKKTGEDLSKSLFEFRKKYGLVLASELMKRDIEEFEKSEHYKTLTTEQQEKVRQNIRDKYTQKLNIKEDEFVEEEDPAIKKAYEAMIAEEEFQKRRAEIREEYALMSLEEIEAIELNRLISLHEQQLLTEEEFLQAKADLHAYFDELEKEEDRRKYEEKIKKTQEYFAIVQTISQSAYQLVMGLQQMEMEDLASKRDQGLVDQEQYEKESKEIKKKYADIQFVTDAAQIVSNTALGIMSAWAIHAANPILAGVIATMVGATGAVQLGVANKQRQRVQQLAKGKYDVWGADDGKHYSAPYEERLNTGFVQNATLVGEEPEIVIDNPTVRNIQYNAPHLIDQLMSMRVNQRASGKYPEYSEPTTTQPTDYGLIALERSNQLYEKLISEGVPAFFNDQETRDIKTRNDNEEDIRNLARIR